MYMLRSVKYGLHKVYTVALVYHLAVYTKCTPSVLCKALQQTATGYRGVVEREG